MPDASHHPTRRTAANLSAHAKMPSTSVSRPNFLCIGVPRSGTTWLHVVLSTHPKVLMPNKKEIHYFNDNYHRGEAWYLAHFTAGGDRAPERVGEVDPMYMYSDLAPQRIRKFGSIGRFIVMLRSPMLRIVSNYQLISNRTRHAPDRAEFMTRHGREFDLLRTHHYISPFVTLFGRERFLFTLYKDLAADCQSVANDVAGFLGIDPDGFSEAAVFAHRNEAKLPRFKSLYKGVRRLRDKYLSGFQLSTLIDDRQTLIAKALFREAGPPPSWLFEELQTRKDILNEDTRKLEEIVGRDLSHWLID